MAEVALALWGVYGIAALGVRVALHRRRTGSTGLVGVRARPGSLAWLAEVGQVVALGLGVAAPVLDLLGALEPIGALDRSGVHVAGLVLFGAGLAGVVASQAAMGDAWRIGTDPAERTSLVTGGPFRHVRNPIYTALVPLLLGLALLVPNVVALASVVLCVVALELQTRLVEEPHLRRVHGDDYARYAARVGRFVPGMGRIRR